LTSKKNILISCAGRRVSLIEAFKKELKALIPKALVFASDGNIEMSAACWRADKAFKIGKFEEANYIDDLIELCLGNDIGVIIPTLDTELLLLSKNENRLKENGIIPIIPDYEFICKCRNKVLTQDIFKNCNIAYPEIYTKDNYKFPFFIKPIDGSLSKDNFVINSTNDLSDNYFLNDKLIFMELIKKETHDEYTVDMYYDKEGFLKCLCPRKRIEIRGGEISKGITDKSDVFNSLRENMNHMYGVRGPINTQVFFNPDSKQIIGIEINPRFGGGYPLSYFAGANFPKFIIEEYLLDRKIEENSDWDDKVLMLRYDAEVIIKNDNESSSKF
jgi:carbamoyl-phosphate synthase large subunit